VRTLGWFGGLETPDPFEPLDQQAKQLLRWLDRGELIPLKRAEIPAMPTTDRECTAEAMRRVLPELIKHERYERRAAGRRARALCSFL
jgi:hypothetical protein